MRAEQRYVCKSANTILREMAEELTERTTAWSRDLPIEIVTDILSRLPSKSLLRFRCVCKSWLHLIADRNFIELHRNRNNNGHVLIQYELHNNYNETMFSLHCDKTFVVEVEQARLELPHRKFDYVGCSNGLVCLSCRDSVNAEFEICLWNPSIRKLKVLPRGSLSDVVFYNQATVVVAFGFVPQMNDYRVLKIVQRYVENSYSIVAKAEIYSLSTNSWKLVENVVPCLVIDDDSKVLRTVNGVVHLVANKEMEVGDEVIILSFDMAEEIFSKILIREFGHIGLKCGVYPVLIGEFFLVLFHTFEPEMEDVVDIWEKIKQPAGAAECWTTKLTIDHYVKPLGFLKNGELVWEYLDQVTSYDPRLPEIKDLQFGGVPGRLLLFTEYMESLVLLDQGD